MVSITVNSHHSNSISPKGQKMVSRDVKNGLRSLCVKRRYKYSTERGNIICGVKSVWKGIKINQFKGLTYLKE